MTFTKAGRKEVKGCDKMRRTEVRVPQMKQWPPAGGTLGAFYFLLYIFVYYPCHLPLSKCCKMFKSFSSCELKEIAKEIGEDKHLRSIFVHIIKDMITLPRPTISC